MGKTEKVLTSLVIWIYASMFIGFILGALFGGRGGMLFVILGFGLGCVAGISRAAYLANNYDINISTESNNMARIVWRRIWVGFAYTLLIYTLILNYFYPVGC